MSADLRPFKARSLLRHVPGEILGRADTGPGGLLVELFAHRAVDGPFIVPAVAEPLLVWIAAGEARIEERDLDAEWRAVEVRKGDLFVVDSDQPYELRWRVAGASFEALHVHLGVPLIEAAAGALFGRAQRPALREASGARDDSVSALLEVIHREIMGASVPAPMLLQGIGQALAVCVLRAFAESGSRLRRRGVLPAFRLRAVVQHMRDRIARPFSLAELASIAGMSPFHFSRMFSRSTGCSPQRYFVGLRVAEAQRLLRETDRSVIEVGLAVGYTSPSHFAQAFRRATGTTPSTYRA
ncbi:helix-turn-helix domain-containing protein [Hansschlegelia sp. KR7-227]|uniref:AraC family transcriptional regulator n=1 Tax=Hansschlegelia sp. KR7-227 TaxID=3400914 RepID=UPI003C1154DA